jgi:hypothetical protein
MNRYFLKRIEYRLKKFGSLLVNDHRYREHRFVRLFGYRPDMQHPVTFNEKIMHRMLQPHETRYTLLSDKLRARHIVKQALGDACLVPLLGVWVTTKEIPLDSLPDRFVLKCSHDSGSAVVVHDKKTHNFAATFRKLNFHLKRNMYYVSREWQYRYITPRVMCEAYVDTSDMKRESFTPVMWRVHGFDATPRFIEVEYLNDAGERHSGVYAPDWQRLPVTMGYPDITENYPPPPVLAEMLRMATILTAGLDYCRLDLYVSGGHIWFSEFTLSPSNGREVFTPAEWDTEFGRFWRIPPQISRVGGVVPFHGKKEPLHK